MIFIENLIELSTALNRRARENNAVILEHLLNSSFCWLRDQLRNLTTYFRLFSVNFVVGNVDPGL